MTKNQPNLTQKQLKKPDLERKSKGKIKTKTKKTKLRKPYDGWARRRRWWWWFGWGFLWRYGGWSSEPNWRWRTHGGWVLAGDGKSTVEWQAREWSTVANWLQRRRRTALVLNGRRNWKTARDGRRPELEERQRTNVGRRWRTTVAGRAWWSTVGRKLVDGEREGKFGGKLGEQKSENGVLQWFCFEIF
jgi:hypothetical protein